MTKRVTRHVPSVTTRHRVDCVDKSVGLRPVVRFQPCAILSSQTGAERTFRVAGVIDTYNFHRCMWGNCVLGGSFMLESHAVDLWWICKDLRLMEGSRPEWYISTLEHALNTPFSNFVYRTTVFWVILLCWKVTLWICSGSVRIGDSILRIPDQNGISRLYNMREIHHFPL